jgi:hypothetical protein
MRYNRVFATVLSLLAAVTWAVAGEVKLAPFVGFATGGGVENLRTGAGSDFESGAAYGLMADFSLGPETWLEVVWSHQSTEFCLGCISEEPGSMGMEIDHFHVGGAYQPGTKTTRPYVAATGGLTVYDPGAAGVGSEVGLSLAVGGGADFLFSDRIGLRLDGRGWLTFASGKFYGTCGAGACSIGFSGGGDFQFQAIAALVIRFPPRSGKSP